MGDHMCKDELLEEEHGEEHTWKPRHFTAH